MSTQRGRGGSPGKGGAVDNEEAKKKLQEAIKLAQKTLTELNLEDGGNRKMPGAKKKQNTRGSQSMMNLSAEDKKTKSSAPKGNKSKGGKATAPNATRNMVSRPTANQPPLLGVSPQVTNPNRNVSQNPYFNMTHPYNTYGNIPPLIPGLGNSAPPLYGNIGPPNYRNTLPSYGSIPPGHNYIPPGPGNVYAQPLSSFDNIPPPPSYDEAILDDEPDKEKVSNAKPTKKMAKSKLTADVLVKTLALFNGQFGTAEIIGRQVEMNPEAVVKFVMLRKDLFAMMGDGKDTVIELVPKVAICPDYPTSSGCNNKNSCGKLHICKAYVIEGCKVQSCVYGHKWDTAHNSAILGKFYLDLIDRNTLRQVVRKVCKAPSKLQACIHYNSDRGCRHGENCRFLHICKSYISGKGKCSMKGCSLNHNLVAQQCSKLLRSHGIATNETPRDILVHVEVPLEEQARKEVPPTSRDGKSPNKGTKDDAKGEKKGKERKKVESSSSGSDDSESSDNEDGKQQQKQEKKNTRRGKRKLKTVKSSDVLGNVEIPEICLFSIDDKCINAKKGCKYLHAKSLFQWQFESNGKWYNFRIFQSKILENAYRDVSKGNVRVPALDATKLQDQAKELLNILGPSPWTAEFKSMTMTCNNLQWKIRRVSTQSSVVFSNPKATVYEWYFQDEQGKWIQYGHVDSLGKQTFVSNVTSEDIEQKYISDPTSILLVSSAHYSYKLDFSRMTQINVDTKKEREIRRRPSRLSYQTKQATEHDPSSAIPDLWNKMADNQTHSLVPLDPNSSEYQEVSSRLRLTLPTAQIQKVQRLQNPYLWRLFQYKKLNLAQRYDDFQLNLQKLFHGTDPKNIDTICKENFDWRQGITVKQSYGQGTYFSHSAAVARGHCIPDDFGRVSLFLAQVIIGTVVKGDPSLTRPPSNPVTNALYDTTVDDVNAPTIFVKYDKEEYYPEYVIEFY